MYSPVPAQSTRRLSPVPGDSSYQLNCSWNPYPRPEAQLQNHMRPDRVLTSGRLNQGPVRLPQVSNRCCWHSPPPAGTSSTQLWDCCCLAFCQESALGGGAGHPPIPILHSFIGYAYVMCNESLFLLLGHLARDPPATLTFCHHRLCSNCPRGPGSPAVLALRPAIHSLGPVPRTSFLKGRSDRAVCFNISVVKSALLSKAYEALLTQPLPRFPCHSSCHLRPVTRTF